MPLKPAYRIVTDRLVLRCWEPQDAPLLKAAIDRNLSHLAQMPWSRSEPEPIEDHIERLRRFRAGFDLGQDLVYGIFTPDEREVVGGTGLHPRVGPRAREIGYWLGASHTGRGLATEAAGAMTRVGFEVERSERIEIHCRPDNARSAAVARRLGYTHEATLRARLVDGEGARHDSMIWSLFAQDFAATSSARLALHAFDAAGRPIR